MDGIRGGGGDDIDRGGIRGLGNPVARLPSDISFAVEAPVLFPKKSPIPENRFGDTGGEVGRERGECIGDPGRVEGSELPFSLQVSQTHFP